MLPVLFAGLFAALAAPVLAQDEVPIASLFAEALIGVADGAVIAAPRLPTSGRITAPAFPARRCGENGHNLLTS